MRRPLNALLAAVAAAVAMPATAAPSAGPSAPAPPLTLHYQERPPYSRTGPDGAVHGLVADPAAAALGRAGIAFHWALTPSQRQLALIQAEGGGMHCGIGWFRSAEREALGRFTAPLYRDRPLAALVRSGAWSGHTATAASLMADPRMRLLVKDGYSYGPRLDRLIADAAVSPQRTSVDPPQMSRMLASGRADWMIVAPEEAEALAAPGLRLLPLQDEPEGPTRHLYCNRAVPAAWIERIDRALQAAGPRR